MYINGKDIEVNSETTAIATGKHRHSNKENSAVVTPLVTPEQLGCVDKNINESSRRVYDAWHNQVASIGMNNSIQQFTDYSFKRLSYQALYIKLWKY